MERFLEQWVFEDL